MNTAAFFDLDDTLIKGNSGMKCAFYYFLSGRISFYRAIRIACSYFFYFIGKADPYRFFENIYAFLKGKSHKSEEKFCSRYFDKKIKQRIYVEAINEINWHKKQGHLVVIVTNSLDIMVSRIEKYLDIDIFIATTLNETNGKFTGKTKIVNYGKNKVKNIKELAKKLNIDLKKSYAYSDNNSDIPMLSIVGKPVATNPQSKMRKHAMKNNWKIKIF
jgi:putative phosphoserine phosphatase / 1-acylglycerol-3-phosphate O-acyltransferase